MKNKLLFSAITVLFLSFSAFSYSQDLDLIVSKTGDSIACRIDSIDDMHIYYEMRSQGSWIHTHINKSGVLDYQRNVIPKKQFNFMAGTSIIESRKPAGPTSIRDIQKNSVYVGILSLNYARMIPIADNVGITFGGGPYHFDDTGIVVESTVLAGGVKHFFESGVMGFYFLGPETASTEPDDESTDGGFTIRIGYRYQGPKGLLLRAAPNFIFFGSELFVFPALSVGYSF